MTTIRGSLSHFLIIWINITLSCKRFERYELVHQELQNKTDIESIANLSLNIRAMTREKAYNDFLIKEGINHGFLIRDENEGGNIRISPVNFPKLKNGFTVKIDMENYYVPAPRDENLRQLPRYGVYIVREFENGLPKDYNPESWNEAGLPNCYYTQIMASAFKKFHKIIPLDVDLLVYPFLKNCEFCGNKFVTLNNRQIYCFPGCKQAAFLDRRNEKNLPNEINCPICGQTYWSRRGKKTCGKARCKKALQRKRGEIT